MKEKIKIAVSDFSPLVIEKDGSFSGFEIDLWERIAQNVDVDYQYEKHDFQEIIPLLADKKVDIGLAGITINEQREELIDFSYPDLDSGLLVLVNKKKKKIKFLDTIKTFFKEGRRLITQALMSVLIFILFFGNLLWLAERSASTFSKNYFPGIFESFWLVICSMSTDSFGDYVPHTWLGRIIIVGIIVGGVAIFGLLIAQVTAFLAVKKIQNDINNYHDLTGRKVGTKSGSTSIGILQKIGCQIIQSKTMAEAYHKLKNLELDAVVFDAPALVYLVNNEETQLETVGDIFDKQRYGIAMQQGSPLREKINQALLKIRESGEYDNLYKKWFGDNDFMD